MNRARLIALALPISLLAVGPAWAAPPDKGDDELRAEARATATEGDHQFEAGRCDKAIALWKKADATFHAPTIGLRIARCQALLGKVVDAAATLDAIAREQLAPGAPAPFVAAQAEARRDLPGVRARIARVSLALDVRARAGVRIEPTIEIDESRAEAGRASFEVDPGDHVIRVRAEKAFWERRVHLDDGERKELKVSLWADEPPAAPRTQRTIGFAVGGVGLGAVIVGAAFGISALATSSHLDDVCGADRKHCPPEEQSALTRVKANATVANVAIGGGAALLATGVILVVTETRPKREAIEVHIVGSAGGLSLGGRF